MLGIGRQRDLLCFPGGAAALFRAGAHSVDADAGAAAGADAAVRVRKLAARHMPPGAARVGSPPVPPSPRRLFYPAAAQGLRQPVTGERDRSAVILAIRFNVHQRSK